MIIYKCDECHGETIEREQVVTITGYARRGGGILLPFSCHEYHFCSVTCFEKWVGMPEVQKPAGQSSNNAKYNQGLFRCTGCNDIAPWFAWEVPNKPDEHRCVCCKNDGRKSTLVPVKTDAEKG